MNEIEFGQEIYLDCKEIWGFERGKSALGIAVICEGVRLGCSFDPVEVVKRRGHYEIHCCHFRGESLKERFKNGGHHRAVAHFIEGVPLKVLPIKYHEIPMSEINFSPISKVILTNKIDYDQIFEGLSCLPRDIAERFCCENRLDANRYLSQ